MAYSDFNYKTATVQEIFERWLQISRQSISMARKHYRDDVAMALKLDCAYRLYRLHLLQAKMLEEGF